MIESGKILKPGARLFTVIWRPGNYRFHVIASNNSGVWNEAGAELDFDIAPAYYQTIWFQALCMLAFITLLWAAYQLRVHQLQQQEKKFRDAVETMPALAFVTDPDGQRTFLNRGWLEYTGLTLEQASGSGWEKAIHPDDFDRVTERWLASRTTGQPLDYEVRLRRDRTEPIAGSRRAPGRCAITGARS